MDEQELIQFKKQLEAMKVDINSDVEKTLTEMTSQTGNIPDPNDRANGVGPELRTAHPRTGAQTHGKGRRGAGAHEDGTYGICAGCGEDIAIKRLQARPVAKFCIDCKTKTGTERKGTGALTHMPELRKDPILGRWVIIAQERGKRPTDFLIEEFKVKGGFCPFAPAMKRPRRTRCSSTVGRGTPIRRLATTVVPNKYPALIIEGNLDKQGEGLYDIA